MNAKFLTVVLGLSVWLTADTRASEAPTSSAGPTLKLLRDTTMMLLKEGNARFVSGKPQHPNQSPERRAVTAAEGQEPLATILACSDSREPVELIFDRGVGELFVIRVAGNVADIDQLASIEYGVTHLNTPVLVVMGHTRCGAVTAVAKGVALHGYLPKLAEKIKPAVDRVRPTTTSPEELVALSIPANVWQAVADIIQRSDLVRQKIKANQVQVVGAVYDLDTGVVSWLGNHPDQAALLETKLPTEEPAEGHGKPAPTAHGATEKVADDGKSNHSCATTELAKPHEHEPKAVPSLRDFNQERPTAKTH